MENTEQYGQTYGKYGEAEKLGETMNKCDFIMVMFNFNKNK